MPAPVYNMNPQQVQQQQQQAQNANNSYQNTVPNAADYGGEFDDIDEKKPERRTVTIGGRDMNKDLLVSKLFYLFFYSSFGSLFPLIAIYFKQLGMNATQAGVLIGLRPFVEFVSNPFWSTFADKFRQGKTLLIFTVLCWIVSTIALNQVHPTTIYCLYQNESSGIVYMENAQEVEEEAAGHEYDPNFGSVPRYFKHMADAPPPGIAPLPLTAKVKNYNPATEGDLVHPPFSTRVYSASNVQEVFVLLMLIILIGEFASSPCVSIADGLTVHYLKSDPTELYAKQRMWGSVGWAVAMFTMGMLLQGAAPPWDQQECKGLEAHEKNYTVCFTAFGVLMCCGLVVAFFFSFPSADDTSRPDEVAGMLMDVNNRRIETGVAMQARAEGPQSASDEPSALPGFIGVLRTFKSPHHLAFLAVTAWMGFGVGLAFSFLFWHLQDIDGGPNLYGIASVINHISEVAAFFFSVDLINKIGHIKVLYAGLLANCLRFLYVAVIPNAWFVLPIELIQGFTHATVWCACSSYITLACPPELKPTAQRMLSTLYHSFGRGFGAILSGLLITYAGTRVMFIVYAVCSLLLFACFFLLNRIFKVAHDAGAGQTTAASLGDAHLGWWGKGIGIGTALCRWHVLMAPHGLPTSVQYQGSDDKFKQKAPVEPLYQEPVYDPTQDAYDKYVTGGR